MLLVASISRSFNMAFTLSPNMSLPIPGVGTEAGPTYANDINSSLSIVDQHNHSAGSGVPINPSGLSINSSLPMNGNQLSLTGSVAFQAQTSDQGLATVYVKGVDLYYEDGSSNIVRITQSGSVSGSAGTITGLPSGTASASYSAGKFTFQSATNTAANIDGGSFVFRDASANSFGVTVQPQNSLGSNYTLTLPSIPAQTNVMTLDASGNMGSTTWDAVGQNMTSVGANAIVTSVNSAGSANNIGALMNSTGANAVAASRTRSTGTSVPAGGVAISASSDSFSTTSSSLVGVTNLSAQIQTSGRPVRIILTPDNTQRGSSIAFQAVNGQVQLSRIGGSNTSVFNGLQAGVYTPSSFSYIDFPSAGTYTYAVSVLSGTSGNFVHVTNCVLIVYEL